MTGSMTPQEAREQLYDVIRSERSFESKARQALDVGTAFLDADSGYLARVDPDTEHWELLVSTEPVGDEPSPGRETGFETSYCRRTVESDGQIALHDAPSQGWADDPAFESQGLACYHGTTLVVDGEPYGTVCFVSEDPRSQFTECECLFAELVARLLERELEGQQYETELTRQANLAAVLNRVLRHNLRNRLSVVRGYTQLMAESDEDSDVDEIALRNIDSLIQLCEKARKLDRIIGTESETERTDLAALAGSVADAVARQYPEATLEVEFERERPVTGQVMPSFERALTELVENAAKHGGEQPTVTVAVEPVSEDIEIHIRDDGPGVADDEIAVLETGAETPLTHGSGLGLWLAHWIVTGHDGTIEATVTDTGTTMTITIPQASDRPTDDQVTELTRAHDQYQAAFEEALDAMVIVDSEGRIVEANPAASDVFGLDSQHLLGRSLTEFLPEEFDFEAAWERFRASESERDTVEVVGADGTSRPVEYTGTTDIVPGHHLIVGRVRPGRADR